MIDGNIIKHDFQISKSMRNKSNNHSSFVIWFTGLSGSGKSTIANMVEEVLFERGIQTYTLDGDNIRLGINKDLSFSEENRQENLRRIAEIAKLFIDAGIVTLAAFISPLENDRVFLKEIIGFNNVVEVFINTSLQECEKRDVKGLYKKARLGEIKNFTGIDAPYEIPKNPDVIIDTEKESVISAVEKIISAVSHKLEI
jgi:adenylylsulfate kinase